MPMFALEACRCERLLIIMGTKDCFSHLYARMLQGSSLEHGGPAALAISTAAHKLATGAARAEAGLFVQEGRAPLDCSGPQAAAHMVQG